MLKLIAPPLEGYGDYTLYTIHYTLYTIHYTLYTIHYTLYTTHYTLHTTHYTLHTTLYTIHYTLCTIHYTLYTIHYTLYTIQARASPSESRGCRTTASKEATTPNPPTDIVDFRGFDSSRILILRGEILMYIGDFPEDLSQAIFVRTVLVGRLSVLCIVYIYIYIYIHIYIYR